MAFISEAQRRWYFANQGKSYSKGSDPIKTLVKQNKRAISKAVDELDDALDKSLAVYDFTKAQRAGIIGRHLYNFLKKFSLEDKDVRKKN